MTEPGNDNDDRELASALQRITRCADWLGQGPLGRPLDKLAAANPELTTAELAVAIDCRLNTTHDDAVAQWLLDLLAEAQALDRAIVGHLPVAEMLFIRDEPPE